MTETFVFVCLVGVFIFIQTVGIFLAVSSRTFEKEFIEKVDINNTDKTKE